MQEAVWESLRLQAEMASGLEKVLQRGKGGGQETELEYRINSTQQKIRHNTVLRSTLYESLCDGTLTKAEYQGMKVEYDRKAMELEGELNRLQEERHEYNERLSSWKKWLAALKESQAEKNITREMALELIQSIQVSGYNDLEIIWNFADEFAHMAETTDCGRKGAR